VTSGRLRTVTLFCLGTATLALAWWLPGLAGTPAPTPVASGHREDSEHMARLRAARLEIDALRAELLQLREDPEEPGPAEAMETWARIVFSDLALNEKLDLIAQMTTGEEQKLALMQLAQSIAEDPAQGNRLLDLAASPAPSPLELLSEFLQRYRPLNNPTSTQYKRLLALALAGPTPIRCGAWAHLIGPHRTAIDAAEVYRILWQVRDPDVLAFVFSRTVNWGGLPEEWRPRLIECAGSDHDQLRRWAKVLLYSQLTFDEFVDRMAMARSEEGRSEWAQALRLRGVQRLDGGPSPHRILEALRHVPKAKTRRRILGEAWDSPSDPLAFYRKALTSEPNASLWDDLNALVLALEGESSPPDRGTLYRLAKQHLGAR